MKQLLEKLENLSEEVKEITYKIVPDKRYNGKDLTYQGVKLERWNVKDGAKIKAVIDRNSEGYWAKTAGGSSSSSTAQGPYDQFALAVARVAANIDYKLNLLGDVYDIQPKKIGGEWKEIVAVPIK